MPTEVLQKAAAASAVAVDNSSTARERGASCISLLAQRRNVLIVCVLSVAAWALLDVRSTTQFRRHHETHDVVDGIGTGNGGAPLLISSDGPLRGSQRQQKGGDRHGSDGGSPHQGGGFDLLDLAETERDWKHRRMQLGSANRSVSLVFFAGLEGTGHHFWQSFLKEFCHQNRFGASGDGKHKTRGGKDLMSVDNVAAPALTTPPPGALCVELSDKIFKLARGVFKRCAPKFDSSHSHHGNGSEIKTPKLLTSANHCYLREASQQGLIDLADGILKSVEQRVKTEHGRSNATSSPNFASGSAAHSGSDVPIFVFVNAFGSNQMWSYPNGKTFNEGRGWNPDASALALIAARLGINFRTIWLRRSPASLLTSTARRNFAEKKTRGKDVFELDGAANSSVVSLVDELQLQGQDFETAARLLEYLGVLTHSQRTLAAQVAQLESVTTESSNTSARVMGVWHHEVSCKPVALAEKVGAFLIEGSRLSPAQEYVFL